MTKSTVEANGLETQEGETSTVSEIEAGFMEISRILANQGVTLEAMLAELRRIREQDECRSPHSPAKQKTSCDEPTRRPCRGLRTDSFRAPGSKKAASFEGNA
jgi:hypothetical protein